MEIISFVQDSPRSKSPRLFFSKNNTRKNNNNNYSVELFNLDKGCTVIFATYQDDRLVEFYPAIYDGDKLPFDITKQFDTIKVMVWSNLTTLKPLCAVKEVSSSELVIE